jgi:hypothetical protein
MKEGWEKGVLTKEDLRVASSPGKIPISHKKISNSNYFNGAVY